ncbi:flagellar assembly protein FliH [Oceanobacillus piezotolerans]|nr:flagellar assembly protein FliH [Oceanobacillus piezotolerans]
MENIPIQDKRVIKIKPVEFFKQEEKQLTPDLENEYDSIQRKISLAKKELDSLIKDQERQKESILLDIQTARDNWDKERDKWIEQAQNEGYTAGFSVGEEDGLQQYQALITQANDIVTAVKEDYHAMLEKSEETIAELAVVTAEKILKSHITEKPEAFLPIVKAAIKEIKEQAEVTIYLSPDNFQLVMDYKEELQSILENDTKLSIYLKEDLTENKCIIAHPFGQIDASVDTQLNQIRSILLEFQQEK